MTAASEINLVPLKSDSRGAAHLLLIDGKEYLILGIRKGFSRGGDYHKSDQHDIVLSGTVGARIMETETLESFITLTKGESVVFPAGKPHMVTAKEDAVLFEWLDGEPEKSFYSPYRKIIDAELRDIE